MGRKATATLSVLLGAAAGAGVASAECSESEQLKMFQGGLGASRVAELCGAKDRPSREQGDAGAPDRSQQTGVQPPAFILPPPPRPVFWARVCVSQRGPCPMVAPVPVGGSCQCNGPFGPAPGLAR